MNHMAASVLSNNNHGTVKNKLPLFDDPFIVSKVAQFHNELMCLASTALSVGKLDWLTTGMCS